MKPVERFLKLNGLSGNDGIFSNDRCSVFVFDDYYEVDIDTEGSLYSDNLSIYWLIGVLTYYGLIDKNYKQ